MTCIDELAVTYSALILQDDEIAVTPEKLTTILKAAKIEVESYWPGLFARALEGVDVKTLITNVSSGVGAAPAASAPAATEAAAGKEAKKEEKKEESEDEEDDDMGFGLFD